MVTDLFELVDAEMKAFWEELISSIPPTSFNEILKSVTPPEAIRVMADMTQLPPDKGVELLDCEGDEIPLETQEFLDDNDGDCVESNTKASFGSNQVPGICNTGAEKSSISTTNLSEFTSNDILVTDIAFLDNMKHMFERHSTLTQLVPFFCQFKVTYHNAQKSIKKRIQADTQVASNPHERK